MRNIFSLAIIIALTSACSSQKPEPNTPASNETMALSPTQQEAIDKAQEETGGDLQIDDEILRLCPGITPPKFAFDSALVKQHFQSALVELSKCMKDGGMKDRRILLVGRADPRGEEDYNLALGGRRASSVRAALRQLGVSTNRVDLTSRGDLDAKGTDEETWAKDRRVDIKLAK